MLKTYFIIAWRNLRRNRSFAITNIFGLSLGIACAILIFTVISYHLSFDKFHSHSNRIYRVVSEFHYDETEFQEGVPQPLGKVFRNDFAFAETSARVRVYHDVTISIPNAAEVKKFQEIDIAAFAEPSFFDIFNFPLLKGNKQAMLTEPHTAVITEKMARKYFGEEEAIGKVIRVNSLNKVVDFTVNGILKDIPANTDRKQQVYLCYDNLKNYNEYYASDSSWGSTSSSMNFFVMLKPGVTKATVDGAIPSLVKKYLDAEDAKVTQFKLQPLSDIHFNPDFGGYVDRKYLWALASIGFFLILTACVNFINMATAQAVNRSKEVGVRKVLGSRRSQLFLQFMTETVIITIVAALLAYVMANVALPYINELFKEKMNIALLQDWKLPVFLVTLGVFVVFMAGSYPGLILSGLRPVIALKGKLSQKNLGGLSLRKALLVVQFAICQGLIIGMVIISGQMRYSTKSDLGFKKDAVIVMPVAANDKTKMNTLRARMAGVPGVEKITFCHNAPASSGNSFTGVRFEDRAKDEPWEINLKEADDQYISAFGLKLIAGRNFFPSDTVRECLVNETLVKKLGFTSAQEAIGKTLRVNGGTIVAPIAGVVKDFYNKSFREAISPIVIMPDYKGFRNCAVKINPAHTQATLVSLEKIWNETYPDNVYSYNFLDESIANFYRLENIMLLLVQIFAGIAILIACLGLYGLVSYMAVQKTKEIGVRKVLGAGTWNILWLFGKQFTRLLLIAFVIATPLAWFTMHEWLQDFAYRMQISPWIFLMVIAFTFIVATITIGYTSLRAAVANPIKSLRTE
jgi:putative ABC transport system permease protein